MKTPRAILIALLAVALSGASTFSQNGQGARILAQDTVVQINEAIQKLEEEIAKLQSDIADKTKQRDDNIAAQERAEVGPLKKLKEEGQKIAAALNQLNASLQAKQTGVDEKIGALRLPARSEVKAHVVKAKEKVAAKELGAAAEELRSARQKVNSDWTRSFQRWKGFEARSDVLQLPAVGVRRAAAEEERQQLTAAIVRVQKEQKRCTDEKTDIEALLKENPGHPNWADLKADLETLKKLVESRSADVTATLAKANRRLEELKKYLGGK